LVLISTNTASGESSARRLQQVDACRRVDVEVVEGALGGQVVARLGGAVDDEVELPSLPEQSPDRVAVADVDGACEKFGTSASSRRRFQVVSPSRPKKSARMLLSTPTTFLARGAK
jgi:hypothetical protein